jgi:quercetin dioxygenase-like cupin family protein
VEGVVYSQALIGAEETDQLRVVCARFEAGGRNLWHTHGFDQALFITEGEGIVATDDEERHVTTGDLVLVPAGERHWHGETSITAMSHLALGIPGTSDFDGVAYAATE